MSMLQRTQLQVVNLGRPLPHHSSLLNKQFSSFMADFSVQGAISRFTCSTITLQLTGASGAPTSEVPAADGLLYQWRDYATYGSNFEAWLNSTSTLAGFDFLGSLDSSTRGEVGKQFLLHCC